MLMMPENVLNPYKHNKKSWLLLKSFMNPHKCLKNYEYTVLQARYNALLECSYCVMMHYRCQCQDCSLLMFMWVLKAMII